MESEMKIVAWRQNADEEGLLTYKLQLEGVLSSKQRKKILSELREWKEVGYGWQKNEKSELRLYSRKFQSKDSWVSWAKAFPFDLQEVNRNGNQRKIN